MDVSNGAATRFTSDRSGNRMPLWAPDGQRIVWASSRGGKPRLYERAVGLTGSDRLLHEGELPMTLS